MISVEFEGTNLVELLVKVVQLCGFCHDVFVHEEWGLNRCVISLRKEIKAVLNECKV